MQAAKPLVEEINQYLTLLNTDQQKAVLTVVRTFAAGQQQKNKHQLLQNTIYLFSDLLPNWDTYNADPISKAAIAKAIQTVDFLNQEAFISDTLNINVFPMRNGGIQLEFDNSYLSAELEINLEGHQTFIRFDTSGNIVEEKPLTDLSQLTTLLEAIQYA